METVEQTAILAAELARLVGGRSRPVISITLPTSLPEHERAALTAVFEQHGAIGADHTPGVPTPSAWLGAGIDPAACFLAGADPAALAARAGVVALRLSNLNATGRCPVNAEGGRLDLPAYTGATLTSDLRWITADTRGCAEPARAVRAALDAWRGLTALPGVCGQEVRRGAEITQRTQRGEIALNAKIRRTRRKGRMAWCFSI